VPPGNPAAQNDLPPAEPGADEAEENIYEVMKQHMARQKEEIDARNAAMKQGARPGPNGHAGPAQNATPPKPVIQRVTNLADLPAVWQATRNYLAANARMLESVLGQCTRVDALNLETSEATLVIPARHERFTGDKARAKLEEAIRAVTGVTLKLQVQFIDMPVEAPPGVIGTTDAAAGMAAQRVPPELLAAVKNQPIIKELIKRLDATVTQVEMLQTAEPEPPAAPVSDIPPVAGV
jgi:hypothetical protein